MTLILTKRGGVRTLIIARGERRKGGRLKSSGRRYM